MILRIISFAGLLLINQGIFSMDIVTIEQKSFKTVLTTPAAPVTFPLSNENLQLIAAMKNQLHELGGVGLAAPQINQPKQIIAVYIPESAALLRDNVTIYPMHIMINPHYKPVENTSIISDFEACYSVKSKAGKVPRYQQIDVEYFDEEGNVHRSIEEGFYARVLQHEIDHINGTLIIDRLTPDCIQGTVEEMMQLRRSQLSDEKKQSLIN